MKYKVFKKMILKPAGTKSILTHKKNSVRAAIKSKMFFLNRVGDKKLITRLNKKNKPLIRAPKL